MRGGADQTKNAREGGVRLAANLPANAARSPEALAGRRHNPPVARQKTPEEQRDFAEIVGRAGLSRDDRRVRGQPEPDDAGQGRVGRTSPRLGQSNRTVEDARARTAKLAVGRTSPRLRQSNRALRYVRNGGAGFLTDDRAVIRAFSVAGTLVRAGAGQVLPARKKTMLETLLHLFLDYKQCSDWIDYKLGLRTEAVEQPEPIQFLAVLLWWALP
jgi:hypothetical protein